MLSQQRDVSRRPIRDMYEELLAADWQGRMEGLLEGISSPSREPLFGRYARRRFKPVVVEFFSLADRKLRSAAEIHRLRIEGKKLRYAMEIFSAVFSPRVRMRCQDALEQLQETLGEFTDHAAAADRFRRWARDDSMTSNRLTLSALRRQEESLANDARKVFVKWWNPTRRRSLRRAFDRTLRRASA
jgi:CHAD domain-containing protein